VVSEPYRAENLLDRLTDADTLQVHYDQEMRREREILERSLALDGGDVLSVGCGWHPGRHLFPKPAFRMTGVDLDGTMIATLLANGELDEGRVSRAGELSYADGSFDVVLYRLVLHHVAYQGRWLLCSRRPPGCCGPAARWSRQSRARGIPSGPGSRSPTVPAWAPGRTARPMTSRCRHARSSPGPRLPGCSLSCTG
jgi:hypothetical protein